MIIEFKKVTYTYNRGLATEAKALDSVDLKIDKAAFIALIGSTGSGKSTLIQLLNGLLEPTEGRMLFDGVDLYAEAAEAEQQGSGKKKDKAAGRAKKDALRKLRKRVGLVFQYPENQLFDETVLRDTAYGPKNLGLTEAEAKEKAAAALRAVGIPDDLFEKSPFELSGGEMRRVAIAGVLAMEPEVLVLDEPTAGLDPKGKEDILRAVKQLQQKRAGGMTVIFVSHSMEEAAEFADRVIAMHQGRIVFDGTPKELFTGSFDLNAIGLKAPEVTGLCKELGIEGVTTLQEAVDAILARQGRKPSSIK